MFLDPVLARQAGVVTREQALRAGLSGAAVDRLVRTRRWLPLHPRVYLVPGHGPPGAEARVRAALLWAGAGSVLCGAAAAWWHGLLPDAPHTLAVSAPVRRTARPGVVVRRRRLDAADRTEHRGLPVAARGLAVLEAAVELGPVDGAALLDRALAGGVDWRDVRAAHRRRPSTAAAALLAAAEARSAAVADALLVRVLRGSGLRGWHRRPATADRPAAVVFPAAGLVVEAAGRGEGGRPPHHGDPSRCAGCGSGRADPLASGTGALRGRSGPGGGRPGDRPGSAAAPPAAAPPAPGRPRGPHPPRLLRPTRAELTDRPQVVLATITAALGRDIHHLGGPIGPPTGSCSRGCPHSGGGGVRASGYREV